MSREKNSLTTTTGRALKEFDFAVDYEFRVQNSPVVDILARRSGLILIVEINEDEQLSLDAIGKLVTTRSYYSQSYQATTIKSLLVTTARIPDHVRSACEVNDVTLIQIANSKEIQAKLAEIPFIRPIQRRKLDIGSSVQSALAERNASSDSYELFKDLMHAYDSGGKLGVERRIRELIKEKEYVRFK